LRRQLYVRLNVAGDRNQLRVRRDLVFGALAFAQSPLRLFLVIPETWLRDFSFEGS